jgi:hypothetical protein
MFLSHASSLLSLSHPHTQYTHSLYNENFIYYHAVKGFVQNEIAIWIWHNEKFPSDAFLSLKNGWQNQWANYHVWPIKWNLLLPAIIKNMTRSHSLTLGLSLNWCWLKALCEHTSGCCLFSLSIKMALELIFQCDL